jgi:hypothetical protein
MESGWLTIRNSEEELKTQSPTKIGRFLTQKIIRPSLSKKTIEHPSKGASFYTLTNNYWSNKHLRNIYMKRSNAFFRFMVLARANTLPTPYDIEVWNHLEHEQCHRCNTNEWATLQHILNSCQPHLRYMTERHNRLVRCVKNQLEKHIPEKIDGQIHENTPIPADGLSDETRNLRPDVWFFRQYRHGKVLEILEFSCPYGYKIEEITSLKKVYKHKK